ncbi:MAG: SH3 domain-containing protein [Bacteroidota bacterium]
MTVASLGMERCEARGVASGFRVALERARVQSDDGYLNLRDGPSTRDDVLHRLPNDSSLSVFGCRRGPRGGRWCFVRDVNEDLFGYVFDRELVYE